MSGWQQQPISKEAGEDVRPASRRVTKPRNGIAKTGIVTGVERPAPLPGLTEDQAREWRLIVDRMPPNWFTAETWPVLANLCRHIVNSNDISRAMEGMRGELLKPARCKQYSDLARMLDRESRAIAHLSGRLRLTPQSRFESYHAATELRNHHGRSRQPWGQQ